MTGPDPLAFARRLVAAGVPVFAAPPGGTVDGYQLPTGWQSIKADPRRLDVWRPGWALAAVCGHGLDVVDVDPRNGGDEALAGLLAAGLLPRTYAIVDTPRGGKHLYVASLGVGKTKRDGIDLQAGAPDGTSRGFVWLPPTARHGGTYAVRDDSLDTFGQDDRTGARLLEWFHAARPANGSAGGAGAVAPGGNPLMRMGTPITKADLHQETLYKYACALRGRGVPEGEAAELVRLRAERDCVPPWSSGRNSHGGPADDPWGCVKHAYNHPEGAPPGEYGRVELELVRPDGPAVAVEVGEAAGRPQPLDWHALWELPEGEEWILEPLVPARRGVALYSAPKLGKSLLMLEVAAAISRGVPVLGITPLRAATVLYVDYENDPRGDIRRRLRTMGLGPDDLGNLRYLSFPAFANFDGPGGEQLLEVALEHGAELVVIDTVSRTIKGEENSNDTWIAFYRNTGQRLKDAGIAYVRLDHTGKDATKGQRGGSAKSGDVDAVWELSKPDAENFLLHCDIARMFIPDEQRDIGFRRTTDPYLRHERVTMSKVAGELKTQAEIWAAIEESGLIFDPAEQSWAKIRVMAKAADIPGAGRNDNADHNPFVRVVKAMAAARSAGMRPDWAPPPRAVTDGCLDLAQ